MKIVIVNPLWSFQNYPPINLTELASYLIVNGFKNTKILDLNFETKNKFHIERIIETCAEKILSTAPDAIAVTCNAVQFPFVCELSKAIKNKNKELPLIIGGVSAGLNPSLLLRRSKADYVIIGEGEKTLLELMQAIKNNSTVTNIKGISYKNKSGKICRNLPRELLNITELPVPAFELIADNLKNNKLVWLTGSRGCAYKCKFCSGNALWHYQRRKDADNIYKQLKILKDEYKIRNFVFGDDCLTLDKEWLVTLCKKIKPLKMNWGCLARIDSVDGEILQALRNSGCRRIYHGIESGSAYIRKTMDKKIRFNTNNFIYETVKKEISAGFEVICSFMTGIPFETKKDISKTSSFAKRLKHLGAKIQLWILTPYPGLKIIREYKRQLIEIDRRALNLQQDVFNTAQFYLYNDFIEKYKKHNPDNYMFLPADMKLEDFVKYFHKMQKSLEIEQKNIQLTNKELFVLKNIKI
ncbi:MAG: radical SAM protein [Endomicrobiaceae bacterium]